MVTGGVDQTPLTAVMKAPGSLAVAERPLPVAKVSKPSGIMAGHDDDRGGVMLPPAAVPGAGGRGRQMGGSEPDRGGDEKGLEHAVRSPG